MRWARMPCLGESFEHVRQEDKSAIACKINENKSCALLDIAFYGFLSSSNRKSAAT
jgi:hypothetical protein